MQSKGCGLIEKLSTWQLPLFLGQPYYYKVKNNLKSYPWGIINSNIYLKHTCMSLYTQEQKERYEIWLATAGLL